MKEISKKELILIILCHYRLHKNFLLEWHAKVKIRKYEVNSI